MLNPCICRADIYTYNIDPNRIEKLVGIIKAIIPVHLYMGSLQDMDSIVYSYAG